MAPLAPCGAGGATIGVAQSSCARVCVVASSSRTRLSVNGGARLVQVKGCVALGLFVDGLKPNGDMDGGSVYGFVYMF